MMCVLWCLDQSRRLRYGYKGFDQSKRNWAGQSPSIIQAGDNIDQRSLAILKIFLQGNVLHFAMYFVFIVTDVKKHSDQLNNHQKIGLKYVEEFEERIPRSEMEQLEVEIKCLRIGDL